MTVPACLSSTGRASGTAAASRCQLPRGPRSTQSRPSRRRAGPVHQRPPRQHEGRRRQALEAARLRLVEGGCDLVAARLQARPRGGQGLCPRLRPRPAVALAEGGAGRREAHRQQPRREGSAGQGACGAHEAWYKRCCVAAGGGHAEPRAAAPQVRRNSPVKIVAAAIAAAADAAATVTTTGATTRRCTGATRSRAASQ